MTDYDKLKKCFDDIGVEYYENIRKPNFIEIISNDEEESYILFMFDNQGKYIEMK